MGENSVAPRIYLAGSEVFFPNAMAQGEIKKRLCAEYGFEGVFPPDNIIERADCVGIFGGSRGAFAPPQCDIGLRAYLKPRLNLKLPMEFSAYLA